MLTAKQKIWRKNGIGGSDVSALYDLNPFTSQVELWVDKSRPGATEGLDRESTRLRCGSHLEAFVVEELRKGGKDIVIHSDGVTNKAALDLMADIKCKGVEFAPGQEMWTSKKYPHMLANTDGHHNKTGSNLEVKTANGISHRNGWRDGVPLYIQLQCTLYLAVTNATFAIVACLVDMSKTHLYVVERDEGLIESMGKKIEAWWLKHVDGDLMPATDASHSCEKALAVLYPKPSPSVSIELSERGSEAALELENLRHTEKLIKKQIVYEKNKIAAELGPAGVGLIANTGDAVYRTKNKRGAISLRIKEAPKQG